MEISMLSFKLSIDKSNIALEQQLLQLVTEHSMAPYYHELCMYFGRNIDESLYNSMKSANEKEIQERKEVIEEKKKNGSEDDVLDLLMSLVGFFPFLDIQGHYYYEIGDKSNAVDTYKSCLEYKMSLNLKMDIWMYILDVYLFHQSQIEFGQTLKIVQKMVDENGDWEHRNRLNVFFLFYYYYIQIYLGVYGMMNGDYEKVANLYAKAIPTFTTFSVFSFNDLIRYAIVTGIMHLSRSSIKQYLVSVSDVEIALFEMPVLKQLLYSFDECRYHDFFLSLLDLEGILLSDPYLRPNASKIIGVLRLKAYQQFLDSFKWYSLLN